MLVPWLPNATFQTTRKLSDPRQHFLFCGLHCNVGGASRGRPTLLHSTWAPAGRKAGSLVSGGWWWEGDPDSWAPRALLSRGSLSTWSLQCGGFRLAGPFTCQLRDTKSSSQERGPSRSCTGPPVFKDVGHRPTS